LKHRDQLVSEVVRALVEKALREHESFRLRSVPTFVGQPTADWKDYYRCYELLIAPPRKCEKHDRIHCFSCVFDARCERAHHAVHKIWRRAEYRNQLCTERSVSEVDVRIALVQSLGIVRDYLCAWSSRSYLKEPNQSQRDYTTAEGVKCSPRMSYLWRPWPIKPLTTEEENAVRDPYQFPTNEIISAQESKRQRDFLNVVLNKCLDVVRSKPAADELDVVRVVRIWAEDALMRLGQRWERYSIEDTKDLIDFLNEPRLAGVRSTSFAHSSSNYVKKGRRAFTQAINPKFAGREIQTPVFPSTEAPLTWPEHSCPIGDPLVGGLVSASHISWHYLCADSPTNRFTERRNSYTPPARRLVDDQDFLHSNELVLSSRDVFSKESEDAILRKRDEAARNGKPKPRRKTEEEKQDDKEAADAGFQTSQFSEDSYLQPFHEDENTGARYPVTSRNGGTIPKAREDQEPEILNPLGEIDGDEQFASDPENKDQEALNKDENSMGLEDRDENAPEVSSEVVDQISSEIEDSTHAAARYMARHSRRATAENKKFEAAATELEKDAASGLLDTPGTVAGLKIPPREGRLRGVGKMVRVHEQNPKFVKRAVQTSMKLGREKSESLNMLEGTIRSDESRLTAKLSAAKKTVTEEFMAVLDDKTCRQLMDEGGAFILVRREKIAQVHGFNVADKAAFRQAFLDLVADRARKAGQKATEGVMDPKQREDARQLAILQTVAVFEAGEWWYFSEPMGPRLQAVLAVPEPAIEE
jgi:hypothetical protein